MKINYKNVIIYVVVYTLCYIIGDLFQLNDYLIPAVALLLPYFVLYLFNLKHK